MSVPSLYGRGTMSDDLVALETNRLLDGGFSKTGEWVLDTPDRISCIGELPAHSGVYAFVIGDLVQYVGVASSSVAKRLQFYARPGTTQKTNIRLNAIIREALTGGQMVKIYTACPPDFEWQGWRVSGPAGLEVGIISSFHLPWNIRGARAVTPPLPRSYEAPISKIESGPPTPVSTKFTARSKNKYADLCEYLNSRGDLQVSMTFAQIEALVGPLPKSAFLHRAWWGNHEANSQAKGWMPARYLAEPNPARRSVVFRKFSY